MHYKLIYECRPFSIWVGEDGTVYLKVLNKDAQPISADIAAVIGAKLVQAAAYVAKETTNCLQAVQIDLDDAKKDAIESATIASRFETLE